MGHSRGGTGAGAAAPDGGDGPGWVASPIRVARRPQQAADRGAFGVPTFFVGDEMFFGKERIIQIEEMIQQ